MTYCYDIIKEMYGDRVANRSQVPLIKHIDDGLVILNRLGASYETKEAYCIHPIVQPDKEFKLIFEKLPYLEIDPKILVYALEYRHVANSYLCKPHTDSWTISVLYDIIPETHEEVLKMLVADKIQNYKDFLRYHSETHERRYYLDKYFNLWLDFLNIDKHRYKELSEGL